MADISRADLHDDFVDDSEPTLFLEKHVKYCLRCLKVIRTYDSLDSNGLVATFFSLSSLDLLNAEEVLSEIKKHYTELIYAMQLLPEETGCDESICGFRGSMACTVKVDDPLDRIYFDKPHLAMTYTALASLLLLGDDLSCVNRKSIVNSLKELQLPDGSFRPMYVPCENDMRFIYCASSISYILQDWSGINIEKAINYIQESITYEGGIAQRPGLEAHGGSTFCAIASLWLMGRLFTALNEKQINKLRYWCLLRQHETEYGFQGRPNKATDTCYTFWVGATLKLIDSYQFVSKDELRIFVLSAQDEFRGGISKWINEGPDPLHTYLGLSGLSLLETEELLPVHPALNISQKAITHLENLHKTWKNS